MSNGFATICHIHKCLSFCIGLKASCFCQSRFNKVLLYKLRQISGVACTQSRTVSNSSAPTHVSDKTVSILLQKWEKTFATSGIPEPDLSALHIMSHVLNTTHTQLQRNASLELGESQLTNLNRLCRYRLQRMPVQYIIGEWDFRDLTLKLRPPVFIPRPETEELVELVLSHLKDIGKYDAKILEVGCGSGAISLSLLKALPQATCVAVDQSEDACSLTKTNAKAYNLQNRLQVVKGQLTKCGILNFNVIEKFDVLVSNPPYIPYCDMKSLEPEIALYEDSRALDGGEDGLRVIKMILDFTPLVLENTGHVFLEVHYNQAETLRKYVKSKPLGLSYEQTIKDFAGKERFVKLGFKDN